MKKYKIITLALVLIFILVAGAMLFYNFFIVQDVIHYKMQYELVESTDIGVNVDTDAIYFGRSKVGGTSKRKVEISNNNDYPVIVSIKTKGNISSMVSVTINDFIMEPYEGRNITYYAKSTKETPLGEYTGDTRILIKRAIFT